MQDQPQIEVIEHFIIPTRDGRKLSARMWRPVTSERLPAIIEYIPYRKRDVTRYRDEPIHGYFARNGFVSLRLDISGSGDSEGLMIDEYALQEQDDALDAIDFLSRQEWCNGAVGMIGKSWGGFNCLQIAARRPPALRAIVPVCATDDRYGDDVHFMGGCVLLDGLDWGAVLQTFLPRPPDPALLGANWREVWQERLDGLAFPLQEWLGHTTRDAYWKHGSICEDYSAIQAATLLIGGWADGYKTAMMRMAARLECPTRCILGPWAHLYPHDGVPGPAIGFLQEAVRWFDHHLKGIENGVMQEPKMRAYLLDSVEPRTHYEHREGRWIGVADWPSEAISQRSFNLGDDGLTEEAAELSETAIPYDLRVGQFGGDWGAIAMPHEQAPDQRHDDAFSLYFDSQPLETKLEILGNATLRLRFTSNRPSAMLAVRLSDVRPDGTVTKIAMGLLNLTHRNGSEFPEPLRPGAWHEAEVQLSSVGYSLPAGHRIRISMSPSYWPIAWPSPEPVNLKIGGHCSLILPQYMPDSEIAVKFGPPEGAPADRIDLLQEGRPFERVSIFDFPSNSIIRRISGPAGYGAGGRNHVPAIGWSFGYEAWREHTIRLDDPASARAEFHQSTVFQRDDWEAEVKSRIVMTSDREHFILNCDVDVFENGERVLSRSWNPRLPRGCM